MSSSPTERQHFMKEYPKGNYIQECNKNNLIIII